MGHFLAAPFGSRPWPSITRRENPSPPGISAHLFCRHCHPVAVLLSLTSAFESVGPDINAVAGLPPPTQGLAEGEGVTQTGAAQLPARQGRASLANGLPDRFKGSACTSRGTCPGFASRLLWPPVSHSHPDRDEVSRASHVVVVGPRGAGGGSGPKSALWDMNIPISPAFAEEGPKAEGPEAVPRSFVLPLRKCFLKETPELLAQELRSQTGKCPAWSSKFSACVRGEGWLLASGTPGFKKMPPP